MKKRFSSAGMLAIIALALASYSVAASPAEPTHGLAAEPAARWTVDMPHTEINFSVTHFFTPVTGSFEEFEVDLDYDAEDPENSSVTARIAVASVNTGNERRDNHLRTADFFAADEYPYITFESTSVRASDGKLVARGPLTIRGETREVELPIKLLGVQQIPAEMQEMLGGAKEIASFSAGTSIDRGDFGVGTGSWAATLVVGGEVQIELLVEAHRR